MVYLNSQFNERDAWAGLLNVSRGQVRVGAEEVSAVLKLAEGLPVLQPYLNGLRRLGVYFATAINLAMRERNWEELEALVEFWERYRDAVVQRYHALDAVELRAADRLVESVHRPLMDAVAPERRMYAAGAVPLVYRGPGGPLAYMTTNPGWNRPFALIALPATAFHVPWWWIALAHEVGHDILSSVQGLAAELDDVLTANMRAAGGQLGFPDVHVDFSPFGLSHRIDLSGEDLLVLLWRTWTTEALPDAIAVLACGPAAGVTLQQQMGFSTESHWRIERLGGKLVDSPDLHPPSYLRNAFVIALLRAISPDLDDVTDELQTRFEKLRPEVGVISWTTPERIQIAEVPVEAAVRSATIAARTIATHSFASFGGRSLPELIAFRMADQRLVDRMIDPLLKGDPAFADLQGVTPRHAIAASVFAFEKNPGAAPIIDWAIRYAMP